MLAPLVVDLLISCILMMLAGWSYDVVGNWTSANRRVACCTESSVIRLRKRIDRESVPSFPNPEALDTLKESRPTRGVDTPDASRLIPKNDVNRA